MSTWKILYFIFGNAFQWNPSQSVPLIFSLVGKCIRFYHQIYSNHGQLLPVVTLRIKWRIYRHTSNVKLYHWRMALIITLLIIIVHSLMQRPNWMGDYTSYYDLLVLIIRWMVDIGMIEITCETSMMLYSFDILYAPWHGCGLCASYWINSCCKELINIKRLLLPS